MSNRVAVDKSSFCVDAKIKRSEALNIMVENRRTTFVWFIVFVLFFT
jgi:hypothetical protein